ncbi:Structure-specific endonuclease subunit SLX1 -like protein [Toxocara canis]|uniref:Structure-specific endonuclease subunit SLX1 homolog n=1 Tax=Toxocara canis TaxID=6265 RepID=A0A0B2V7R2_TOXCA|nr:Structure-specific endonuclease subunit SLX1 -like protein [Toxocara canis]
MECEGLRFFIYRDPRRAEGDSASDVLRFKRRSFSQHVLSDRQNAEENEDRRQCFSQISPTPPTDNGIGHAEPDEKEIKKRGRRAAPASVPDEFFGVYCLISRSPNKYFKNRCYIGYTVDPNRRIRQHNAGKQFGGASRTDHRGPWDMVCIIHGFPNSVSALRFEWAWQNPDKSRRLRSLSLKKKQKESAFAFRFRIACHMLNSDPWRRLSLTFRWLLPSSEIAFPPELPLSPHMSVARGLVEKTSTLVPQLPEQYIYIRKCAICSQTISKISELVRCTAQQQSCGSHFHMRCLSKTVLAASNELHAQLFPISGKCPKCDATFIWGDLIRDQRLLLSIDKAKPIFINEEHAVSKVPAGKLLKI